MAVTNRALDRAMTLHAVEGRAVQPCARCGASPAVTEREIRCQCGLAVETVNGAVPNEEELRSMWNGAMQFLGGSSMVTITEEA